MKVAILRHEAVLALVVVCLAVAIGLANPSFFSLTNLFDLLKSGVVVGIFAIATLLVLASGGIDISFTAIAAFSMYVTCRVLVAAEFTGSALPAFLLVGALGTGLGLINATFISVFRLPTLIVTLGTASLFRGFLLAFVGTAIVNNLPPGLVELSRHTLFEHTSPSGETAGLSVSVLFLVVIAAGVWAFLRFTVLGRGVYAIGGCPDAASRAGFGLHRLRFLIYALAGCFAGLAGLLHATMMRNANPFDLVGTELDVIAAVVLGGASITGGRGSVPGTLLGVGLIVMINNSLILVRVPSYWQKVVVGLIIIASTWASALRERGDGHRTG